MAARVEGPKLKPQRKVAFETCTFKIDSTTFTKLKTYCKPINSEESYVIREMPNQVLDDDPVFLEWYRSR